jgi:FAD/FMN-containing dehydrogenase
VNQSSSQRVDFETKKQRLQHDIKRARSSGQSVRLQKRASNLFRHRQKSNAFKIDVRDFNRVISIDPEKRLVDVEGMTTYEALVAATLPHGLMPTVVPELKSITVGGAVAGIGIEATSFKYGLVHETVQELEVLLANGETVICGPTKNSDLFYGFPNSYGTLGYALRVQVKLVPVEPFVLVTHQRFTQAKNFFEALSNACTVNRANGPVHFIDGVIFSKNEMHLNLARFIARPPVDVQPSDYTYRKIYYRSLQNKKHDVLSTRDYIWRWDTDWFWCSSHFGAQNPLIRTLAGRKLLRSTTYWKIRALAGRINALFPKSDPSSRSESVVQDVEIPIENAEHFLEFFQREIGIRPIWVCPTKAFDASKTFSLYAMDPHKLYVNFGFWDVVKSTTPKPPGFYNKKIEAVTEKLAGKKSLYSTSFYTPETFWRLYNKKQYDQLKSVYDPDRFLKNLYQKAVQAR